MSNSKRLITKSYLKNSNGRFNSDRFILSEGFKVLAVLVGFMVVASLVGCDTSEFNGTPADGDRYERSTDKCEELPEWCQQ